MGVRAKKEFELTLKIEPSC